MRRTNQQQADPATVDTARTHPFAAHGRHGSRAQASSHVIPLLTYHHAPPPKHPNPTRLPRVTGDPSRYRLARPTSTAADAVAPFLAAPVRLSGQSSAHLWPLVNGVVATRKERNAMEVSSVVQYNQNMVRHNSMSAKELKAPTHATVQASSILYIGFFGIRIPSAEALKEDIKPNFITPPNLSGKSRVRSYTGSIFVGSNPT